jgi:hypothetical protein
MKKMKLGLGLTVVAAMLSGICASGADAVSPASCTFTNSRTDTLSYVSDTQFYRGSSLLFTNCLILTTGNTTQGLDGVIVELRWGDSSANNCYTGIVQSAAGGTWYKSITVPTNWEAPNIQLKVTDTNGNSYIYPWRLIHTKAALQ